MKTTGITRAIDPLGRITNPKEIRKNLGVNEGEYLEFLVEGDVIGLRKITFGCDICKDLTYEEVGGIKLCKKCATRIYERFL